MSLRENQAFKEKWLPNRLSNVSFILFKWATDQPARPQLIKDFWRHGSLQNDFYSDNEFWHHMVVKLV